MWSSLSCRFQFQLQSLFQPLRYNRRYFRNRCANFKLQFDCCNDSKLLLEFIREQSKLGFHNLEFPLSLFRRLISVRRRRPRPSIGDFNMILSAMVKLKHLRPHSIVISLLRELELSGVRFNLHSATILANCFCHLGRVDLGFSVFGKSLKIGHAVESNLFFFNTLIHGYILSNQPQQAVKLLDKVVVKLGVELNHVTYGIMIKGLCSVGDNAGALRVLRLMNSRLSSCNLDLAIVYTTLIDRFCKDRLPNEALSLFSDMKTAGIKPDVFTYNSLIRGLFIVGRKGEATKMLTEMLENNVTPNVVTYSILVDMHCKDEMIDEAQAIIQIMVERGVTPNIVTYNALLNGWFLCDQMDEARKVFDMMVNNSCAPDVVTFTTLINGYVKLRSVEEALVVLQEMFQQGITPDVYTYNTLIDGLCKSDRIPMAFQVFSDMQIHGVKPNSVTYGSLLDALCKSGQLYEAAALFREMERNGIAPNIVIYSILIDSLFEAGHFKEARNLFCDLATKGCLPNTKTYTIVIKWLCRNGLMSKAMELLYKMERNGCAPNSVTYNTIIEGCIAIGDFTNAVRYRDIMVSKGFEADNNSTTTSLSVELRQKIS